MCKMKNIRTILVLLSIILFLYGCGKYAMGTVRKTNQLEPGMGTGQVKGIMGDPDSTQFKSNKWVWKYSLHQEWKGFVPYYLVFGKSSKQLESWFADENEYYRQQSLWLQAMPPIDNLIHLLTIGEDRSIISTWKRLFLNLQEQ